MKDILAWGKRGLSPISMTPLICGGGKNGC